MSSLQSSLPILTIQDIPAGVMAYVLGLLTPQDIFSFLKVSRFTNSCKDIVTWKVKADEIGEGYERTDPSKSGYHRFLMFLFNKDVFSYLTFDLLSKKAIITKLLWKYQNSPDQFYKYADRYTDYDLTGPTSYIQARMALRCVNKYTGRKPVSYTVIPIKEMFTVKDPADNNKDLLLLPRCIRDDYKNNLKIRPREYKNVAYIRMSAEYIDYTRAYGRRGDIAVDVDYLMGVAELYHEAIRFGNYDLVDHINSIIENGPYHNEYIRAICSTFPKSATGYIPPDIMSKFNKFYHFYSYGRKITFKQSISPINDDTLIIQEPMLDGVSFEDTGKEIERRNFSNLISRATKRMILEMSGCTNVIKLKSLCNNLEYVISSGLAKVTLASIKIIVQSTNMIYIEAIISMLKEVAPNVICEMELYVYECFSNKCDNVDNVPNKVSNEIVGSLGISLDDL